MTGPVLVFVFITLVAIGQLIYLLPFYIAAYRKHNNGVAIFALNLFTGWSFIGWVASLVWALTDNVKA